MLLDFNAMLNVVRYASELSLLLMKLRGDYVISTSEYENAVKLRDVIDNLEHAVTCLYMEEPNKPTEEPSLATYAKASNTLN